MNALGLLVPPPQTARASLGLLILRVFAGYAMMVHGWPKIQAPLTWGGPELGIPGAFRALAAVSEFGGGLAWILGLLTPVASFGLAFTMAVATGFHVGKLGHPLVANVPPPTGELPALFFCVAALLLLAGPGRWSADARLFPEKR